VEYLRENLLCGVISKNPSFIQEESCDFSETSMLENAIIAPPKLENRCSMLAYQDIIRSNEKKEIDKLQVSVNQEDRTIIEYDSMFNITEEFELKVDEKSGFFNKAKNHLELDK
jgi:hypothetical protein